MIFLPTMTTEIKMEILKPKVKKKKKLNMELLSLKQELNKIGH